MNGGVRSGAGANDTGITYVKNRWWRQQHGPWQMRNEMKYRFRQSCLILVLRSLSNYRLTVEPNKRCCVLRIHGNMWVIESFVNKDEKNTAFSVD